MQVGTLLLAAVAPAVWAQPSTPWPELPAPPRSRSEWVAQNLRVNGLPTRIERFESELAVAEVLAHYRAHWARSPDGPPRETRVGEWDSIATLHGPFQIAVQARPRRPQGSQGYLSVANFVEAKADFVPAWLPLARELQVVQVSDSVDGPKRSELVLATTRDGFEIHLQRQRGEWLRRAWSLAHEQQATAPDGTRMYYATFSKGSQVLDLTLTRRPAEPVTQLAVNLVRPLAEARR
jgi:hypothetical protein